MVSNSKILFLEAEEVYQTLFDLDDLKQHYDLIFWGVKDYKRSDDYFSSYSLIVYSAIHSITQTFIIYRAKSLNIKTLFVFDGIYEWANAIYHPFFVKCGVVGFNPIPAEYCLCVGEKETHYFQYRGINTMQYLPERMFVSDITMPLPGEDAVLITTANSPGFNDREKDVIITILSEVIQSLREQNIKYYLRIMDETIFKAISSYEKNILENTFAQALEKATIVITTPSSVLVEAMACDRAVGMLIYRDTPVFTSPGWLITKGDDFKSTIKSMISRDDDRMAFQRYQVKSYDARFTGKDAIGKVISDICPYKESKHIRVFNRLIKKQLISPYNVNFEYMVRKLFSLLKGNRHTKHFYSKFKLAIRSKK